MSEQLPAFDPNDYRKRVLAAVEKRGGPETSDPFELYDLPLSDELSDAAVRARIDEVWGAWQRQRDHPKYRVLVALLVEQHTERSAELLDAGRRAMAVRRVRLAREERDSARYELLDAAVSRLVARHGGLPEDKVEGLYDVGALAGLTRAEVEVRLRRHRRLRATAAAAPEPAIGAERRRQIRSLLDEFARLTDRPPVPTLLALLEVAPAGAAPEEVRVRAAALRGRTRELPPDRLRTVLDELLVHVAELLEPGRDAILAYLDAVAVDVTDYLRPRVRAAVLVEDRLVEEDRAHLLQEALDLGLDRDRAEAVLSALAAEHGAPAGGPAASRRPPRRPANGPEKRQAGGRVAARPWEEPLKAARAALRAGRPVEAKGLVEQAEKLAGGEGGPRLRAVADEIAGVLADAGRRWRAITAAAAALRWVEALQLAEEQVRTAADVPGPAGEQAGELRDRAAAAVAGADQAAALADRLPADRRVPALRAVLAECADHPGAQDALARVPVEPPPWVSAARDTRGDVLVLWEPSPTPDVSYKVSRLRSDGSWQVIGRVHATTLDDGGAPPGVEVPVYAVAALQAGRVSDPTRSDVAAREPDPVPHDVRAVRAPDGGVWVSWAGVGDGAEYRVRCQVGADRWRVVGRTTDTSIEDGGAPPGPVPVYGVSASIGGVRTAECRSDA